MLFNILYMEKEASLLQMSPYGNKTGEKMDVANCSPAVICNYAFFNYFCLNSRA